MLKARKQKKRALLKEYAILAGFVGSEWSAMKLKRWVGRTSAYVSTDFRKPVRLWNFATAPSRQSCSGAEREAADNRSCARLAVPRAKSRTWGNGTRSGNLAVGVGLRRPFPAEDTATSWELGLMLYMFFKMNCLGSGLHAVCRTTWG